MANGEHRLDEMNELDELRLQHATAMVAKGHDSLASNPSAGYYDICSGRMLMITTKLKDSGELPTADIRSLVDETADCVTNRGVSLDLEMQNEILVLALAAGFFDGASSIARIDCDTRDSHGFDVRLNRLLRSFFAPSKRAYDATYTATATEGLLFDDIDAVAQNRQTDFSGTDRYWKATKSKRYSNTVFAGRNLFRTALEQLKRI